MADYHESALLFGSRDPAPVSLRVVDFSVSLSAHWPRYAVLLHARPAMA